MQQLLDKLATQHAHPLYAQTAENGEWERMIKVLFDGGDGKAVDASKFANISNPGPSQAVEFFYRLEDGSNIFFGVRFGSSFKNAPAPIDFLQKIASLLQPIATQGFMATVRLLGTELNDNPGTFLHGDVSFLELGVADWWKSEGSKRIWVAGEAGLTAQSLSQKLSDQQQLLRSTKNYVALECAIGQPEQWLGIEVSTHKDDHYELDLDKVLELAGLVTR